MSELESNLLPGAAADASHSAATAHLGHLAAETQLSSVSDIAAARHFFQPAANLAMPAPAFSGAEATAVAGKAAAAATTGGAEASAVTAAAKSIASIASSAGAEAAALGS